MGEGVHDDINAQGVRNSFGVESKILLVLPFTLPSITDVVVVTKKGHQTSLVVEVAPEMRAFIAFWIPMPVFERVSLLPGKDARDLRHALEIIDKPEEFMILLELPRFPIGEDLFHFLSHVSHGRWGPEIVSHEESAVEKVAV